MFHHCKSVPYSVDKSFSTPPNLITLSNKIDFRHRNSSPLALAEWSSPALAACAFRCRGKSQASREDQTPRFSFSSTAARTVEGKNEVASSLRASTLDNAGGVRVHGWNETDLGSFQVAFHTILIRSVSERDGPLPSNPLFPLQNRAVWCLRKPRRRFN